LGPLLPLLPATVPRLAASRVLPPIFSLRETSRAK
jgi:hypothetical protein